MDPITIAGLSLSVAIVVVRVIDKALPSRADQHLENIADAVKEMLKLQRKQSEEQRVDQEQLRQILRSIERLEIKVEKHTREEDTIHKSIASHLSRIMPPAA